MWAPPAGKAKACPACLETTKQLNIPCWTCARFFCDDSLPLRTVAVGIAERQDVLPAGRAHSADRSYSTQDFGGQFSGSSGIRIEGFSNDLAACRLCVGLCQCSPAGLRGIRKLAEHMGSAMIEMQSRSALTLDIGVRIENDWPVEQTKGRDHRTVAIGDEQVGRGSEWFCQYVCNQTSIGISRRYRFEFSKQGLSPFIFRVACFLP